MGNFYSVSRCQSLCLFQINAYFWKFYTRKSLENFYIIRKNLILKIFFKFLPSKNLLIKFIYL